MNKPKVGLLPLYLELYDQTTPEIRPTIDRFHAEIVSALSEKNLEVLNIDACRVKVEFEEAVRYFEEQNVDAIITLHLAYSPSLESEQALAKTKLPIIILDTTLDNVFNHTTDPAAIMYNHGIHGVMDMCNLLRRNGKTYEIFAGHYQNSDVLDKVVGAAKAAMVAHALRTTKVGIIGEPFAGMGDFALPFDLLKETIGMDVIRYDFKASEAYLRTVSDEQITKEREEDFKKFINCGVCNEVYDRTAKVALAVRNFIEEHELTAFTINFLATELKACGDDTELKAVCNPGFPVMPFLETSKAMARGIGYAGEGDVMTAALVGALLKAYKETTFTEMFCPDWQGESVFLSHMGEYNLAVSSSTPRLCEKEFPFTCAENPAVLYSTFKGGDATFINLAPLKEGKYAWILAEGKVLDIPEENQLKDSINGWFKPNVSLAKFLEEYSRAGGTHHSVMVYGVKAEELALIGKFMGFEIVII